MSAIAVVDYDMGNLHSVCKGLENAGATPKITDSPMELLQADAIVLPGVGSFDPAVQHLRSRGLESPIKKAIAQGIPFLGICLGLQILFDDEQHKDDEEERIIDKLLIHYSKKPPSGEEGKIRRKSKSRHPHHFP